MMILCKHLPILLLLYLWNFYLSPSIFVQPEVIKPSYHSISNSSHGSKKPTQSEAIGYGFLATTITNMAALTGVVCSLLQSSRYYHLLLAFMVAVAVGSLFSTAILVLIPESLQLMDIDGSERHWYVPAAVAVCAGGMGFFVLEFLLRRLRLFMERRVRARSSLKWNGARGEDDLPIKVTLAQLVRVDSSQHPEEAAQAFSPSQLAVGPARTLPSPTGSVDKEEDGEQEEITFCTPNLGSRLCNLPPVVWMILIGDGLHNFMDGLTIGTAFTDNIGSGISLSLAILFEELPHELGDFAILLKSGLSVWLALLFNFLSACMAYVGFFIGVMLGSVPSASVYIYAITAGFFLYIALADMLPELYLTRERGDGKQDGETVKLFGIHCAGLLFGFACILTVTLFGDKIYTG